MHIIVNGQPRELPEAYTLAALLQDLEIAGRRIAVEVNLEIVPRSLHAQHALRAGDRVEIVHAIGGG